MAIATYDSSIREPDRKGGIAAFFSPRADDLSAWLVSAVVHLVGLLLLGLWVQQPADNRKSITLATCENWEDLAVEGEKIQETPLESFELQDAGAVEFKGPELDLGASHKTEVVMEPVEVPLSISDPVGKLPDTSVFQIVELPAAPLGHMFAGRDPQGRARVVKEAGGTSATEAAVARGLTFLARHQREDGSWSLEAFAKTPDCDETCKGAGHEHSDMAATALGLLPFLGAGQTHLKGQYAKQVLRGLNWILEHQKEDGDLRGQRGGNTGMYAHGQASIVLCEAFALTGDGQLREPSQLALNFIVRAQHADGGWRYEPGQPGDTSVVGWQLMALKSGQMAHLHVPQRTFALAGLFLDQVQRDKEGGQYSYQRGGQSTPAMTAEALLCRQYLGWPKNHPGLQAGVQYLLDNHLPEPSKPSLYFWYYATQVMHHQGGDAWKTWNAKMHQTLLSMQEKHGHAAGSWAPVGQGPEGGYADRGGRIYMTSLAACVLEVYYRHLPIYSEEILAGFH